MTAVIVAHDGVTWLPAVADAVLDQTRPVQRVVAVDTGSRDRSGAVLASKFGQAAAFGMDRATGYGTAVARAVAHRAANVPVPGAVGGSSSDKIEWLWLLHDDCEPAPDALEQLLRGAAETSAAAVLGPKIRDWSNREVILEAGVTVDTATRRVTGIEPREVDQGQHDGDRDTLAVSSAGMLVRRDVWDQVGGFDTGMGLFMEDIDFCWRVHSAGYRVRVITDAIVYHAQAATKRKRPVSVGRRPRMLDRRNGLLTLLGNLPLRQMLTSAGGNAVLSLLRITFFLLAKRLAAAMDEAAALASALCHPIRLISMRGRRSSGRRAAYARVRADLPPGRSMRRLFEFAASTMLKSAQVDTAGSHHASADPTDDDSMLVDNGLGKRLLTSPSLLTFVLLLAVALYAGRSLIGSGPLGGGSLVPAWGGASDLWQAYLQAFHPAGIGSDAATPPYVAVLAALATVLGGRPWLAIDVILIGCVPLAGMTAMLAVRRVTKSALVRVWASVTYALLPVATGVVASGRFGSAVVFVLLPLIALQAGWIFSRSGQQAGRAAWAAGLLIAVGAAFVPLLWVVAFLACCLAAIAIRNTWPGMLRNLLVVAVTAPVLLLPWTLTVFSHPADLLLEAGLAQPGTPAGGLPARMLLLLSPGGPGLPPYWATAGLLAAAFAALFAGRRRRLIMAGWGVALSGLLVAVLVSHLVVSPADGGPVIVWAGLPLAIAALGLLLAASVGADALGRLLAGRAGWKAVVDGRGLWAALMAIVACSTPLIAAAVWISTGVSGPVHPVTSQVVPELVAVADGQSHQVRTLVLRTSGGHISYLLLRGPSPGVADVALTPPAQAQQALSKVVATLTSPDGGLAANESQLLADFDIGYVLVQAPVDQNLAGVLNDVSGLRPYSTTSAYDLWQLATLPARVSVAEPNGTVVPIPSGLIEVSGASVPASGGTLLLAEPTGGWSAAVNGHPLTPVASPAGSWAQAFRLPAGGGTLTVGHSGLGRDLVLVFELLALLAVIGLGLPGIRVAEQDGQHAGQAEGAERAAGRASARSPAGRGAGAGVAAEAADADEAPRRDLVGAPGRATSGRSMRRASQGRAGKAVRGKPGRGKTGRDRAGRDRAGRDRAGRDETAGDLTSTGETVGLDTVGRGRRGQSAVTGRTARGRSEREAADPDETMLDSPALPAGDRPGRPGTSVPAGRPAGQRGSRLADAWPYGVADEPDDEQAGLADSPQARAWPYQDEDSGSGARHDPLSTGPTGRPARASERQLRGDRPSPAGRPPAGRSPGGAWPYADLETANGDHDAALADRAPSDRAPSGRSPSGRSPSGRSPSGGGPVGGWSDPVRENRARHDRGGYDRDRPYGGGYGDDAADDFSTSPPFRGLAGRDYEADDYGARDYRTGAARGRHHGAEDESGGAASRSGAWPYPQQPDPAADEPRRPRPGPRQDRWGRRVKPTRPGANQPRSDLPAANRPAEPHTRWPGGDGDELEPLPPLGGPGRPTNRVPAWPGDTGSGEPEWDRPAEPVGRPEDGGRDRDRNRPFAPDWSRGESDQDDEAAGDWDRFGGNPRGGGQYGARQHGAHQHGGNQHGGGQHGGGQHGEQRWSEPEPEYPEPEYPEPEYEGDTW